MSCVFTPSLCHINLGALKRNFRNLGKPDKLLPVIKADAYGHGFLPVAKALAETGAVRFAVGTVSEGETLRQNRFNQQIIPLLGCLSPDEWRIAGEQNLTPIIASFEDLTQAAQMAEATGIKSFQVALKCDTGMGRLGFSLEETGDLLENISSFLKPSLLLSHLACADMPEEEAFTQSQITRFKKFHAALSAKYPDIETSLGNSAATMKRLLKNDLARPGLALYGGEAYEGNKKQEWVMSVSAPIIQVRTLNTGQSVSYGRQFIAPRPMKIAIVGAGYATGFNRALSNNASLMISGKRAPQIGRVCMGMTMVDVEHIPDVKAGDRAWILGGKTSSDEIAVTAQELATKLGTIPYEILCLMGSLNPRAYVED